MPKLSEKTKSTSITESDALLGRRDNGDGTFTDFIYQSKKIITAGSSGSSLTDAFFSNTITEIVTNGQAYMVGVDFTQLSTTITWINGASFVAGQKLIAKL